MPGKQTKTSSYAPGKNLLSVHLVGALICVLIAGSSLYFAGNSLNKRRGLFFSARHELESSRALLNESVAQRTSLVSRVESLEQDMSEQIDLVSVKLLNARNAEIVEIAESVNIRVDSLQPGERIVDQRVPVQPLSFAGEANADDVYSFLGLMGERMPDIHFQMIDLRNSATDSSSVHIMVQMYWFVDPADAS